MTDFIAIRTALAAGPTRGDWAAVGSWVENVSEPLKDICDCRPGDQGTFEQGKKDAAFIAACNPKTITTVLALVDHLQLEVTRLRGHLSAAPAWHDEPTCVGVWVCDDACPEDPQHWWLRDCAGVPLPALVLIKGARWYGPLPTDTGDKP